MSVISIRDLWYGLILSGILVAVVLLIVATYQFFIDLARKRRKISRRLSEGDQWYAQRVQILKDKRAGVHTDWRLKLLQKILGPPRFARLESQMLQADIYLDTGTFLTRVFYLGILGFAGGFWGLKSGATGLIFGFGLMIIPFLYIRRKKRIKTEKFEKQMPDAMELLARSLRAGHTLPSAIELLGHEMANPMGAEMIIAHEEYLFGISISEALLHMLERVESMDLKYFVSAVLIQQETGGNLAELMENIAHVVRGRLNFKSKVRSLTAMGRTSATVMIVIPILAFSVLMVIANHYEKILLTSSIGRIMLLVGVILMLIGAFLLKKMMRAVET